MSLSSWLRGSNGMADSAQMGRFRRRTAPSRPATRFRPRLEALEDRTVPSTFRVADVAGLQAAVAAVNSDPSHPATIVLDPGTYDLTSELQVVNASHLTIQGDTSGAVILDNPSHSDRIFEIDGGDVTIDGLVINGGSASEGGGILADNATLTVDHSTISGNSATDNGGGIFAVGSGFPAVTVKDSTISGNLATFDGGGIYINSSYGTLTVKDSTISGNSASFSAGGGIFSIDATVTVDQSTISGNSAPRSGGIFAYSLTVKDSTISGNSASYSGGGIFTYGPATIDHSTISGNSAPQGGGIFTNGALTVKDSTISDNTATSGGGIYASYATVEIDNSTLNDPVGGGIVNVFSTIHLKQTVVDGVLYANQDYP